MRFLCRVFAQLALACLLAAPVGADPPAPSLTASGYACGPAGFRGLEVFPIDSTLSMFGVVTELAPPFDTTLAGSEITFVVQDVRASGWFMWDDLLHSCGGGGSGFTGGELFVYVDETPDATPGDLDSYRDGQLLLGAATDTSISYWTESGYPCYFVRSFCLVDFTEGALLHRFSPSSAEKPQGSFSYTYDFWNEEPFLRDGAFATINAELFLLPSTPARPTSWGRIKARYP